ncbi:hypothetical protein GGS21DRAFT_492786 [Xylaria nigripes]|nr:hypothetical protein GGS21DRAFT_492786 [Xylaria nigripes]
MLTFFAPTLGAVAGPSDNIAEFKLEAVGAVNVPILEKKFASPLWHQVKLGVKPTNVSYWRSPKYHFTRVFNHIVIAVLTGPAYLQLDNSISSLQYKVFVILRITILPALLLIPS